jgi:hypothetical protein
MDRIDRNPLHAFFLFNMIVGLLVLAGILLLGAQGEALRTPEYWQAGGTPFRIALAALLYSLFAGYADLYFRPQTPRKM